MDKELCANFFGYPHAIPEIKWHDAEQYVRAGLEYFCGPEYKRSLGIDEVCQWLTDNNKKGLFLMGDTGTGKTLLATRIILPLVKWYMTHKSGWYEFNMTWYSAYDMKEAFECKFHTCIDGVGVESFSNEYGKVTDYFSRIIDEAERCGLLLICTTHLNADQLVKKYGARTFDRIKSLMRPIVFKGESLRK